MNGDITYYQNECANQVYNMVKEGKKRITILLPRQCGRTRFSILVAQKICSTSQKAFIIEDLKQMAEQGNDVIAKVGASSVECLTIRDMVENKRHADVYVLHLVRPVSRKCFVDYLGNDSSSIVVSIGERDWKDTTGKADVIFNYGDLGIHTYSEKELAQASQLVEYYSKLGDVRPLLYSTESIVDIRDIIAATPQEKKTLVSQIKNDEGKLLQVLTLLSKVSKANSELETIIEKQKRQLEYQNMLLASCGISSKELDEEFSKIEALREEMKNKFYNADGSINDTVMSQFETAVADSVVKLTRHVLTLENRDRYEDILMDLMSADVWNGKLSKESKSYLITAKMNYELMLQLENRDELDFSGVCLLVTKVLDAEMARRLYTSYCSYLERRFRYLRDWPRSLLNKDKTDILESNDFTLGTVGFVVGIDKDGVIKNDYVFRVFKDYARNELYKKSLTDDQREQHIKNMVSYVEKVRVDYRNPAAHRNLLNFVTAKDCMDYMLDTYKIIKEILEDMRF